MSSCSQNNIEWVQIIPAEVKAVQYRLASSSSCNDIPFYNYVLSDGSPPPSVVPIAKLHADDCTKIQIFERLKKLQETAAASAPEECPGPSADANTAFTLGQ